MPGRVVHEWNWWRAMPSLWTPLSFPHTPGPGSPPTQDPHVPCVGQTTPVVGRVPGRPRPVGGPTPARG